MEIKEYKLGDICVVKNGTKNKEDCSKNGKYNFYTRSKIVLKSNDWTVDGECTIIPGEGIFYPLWNNGKAAIHQRVYYIKSNELILKNKYLYYWWFKNSWILYQNAVGTTVKSLRMNNFIDPKIKLPNIQTQQAIINIIEPFENLKNKINNKLHYLKDITLICINNFNLNKKFSLNNFVNFQGFSFKSNDFIPNNGKYIIYKISNITNSKQNTSYTNNLISSCLLREGDVVTGLSGTIGTSDVILESDKFLLNQRLLAIKTNYPLLIKLIIENNKNILEKKSTGSVQMNITKNDVLNIKYDSNLNNVFNNLISKLYINYSKKIILINNAIKLLIDLYIF